MSSWAALLALVPRSLATSHEEAKGVCTVPDCPQHLTASSLRGNYSPRAARRHLAKPAQCAYRADPRKDSGTVAALRQYQRDGGWCRLNIEHSSKNRYSGDWVGMGGQRYFLPLKWAIPKTAYYLAPASFSHASCGADDAACGEAKTIVRVWGCVVARCWRANHSPIEANASEDEWPAGTWPTHV